MIDLRNIRRAMRRGLEPVDGGISQVSGIWSISWS
jgi:hypothetical protein